MTLSTGLKPGVNDTAVSAYLRGFRGGAPGYSTVLVCFTEQLADHVFYRHFLHVYVANVARLEKLPAGFRNLSAWNLQLYRDRCLFDDFAKPRQITHSFGFKSKTQNLIA